MMCRQRASATLLYEVFTGEVAADAVVRMERKRSPGHAGPDFADEAGQELSGYAVALSDHADRGSGPDRVAKAPLKRTTQADTR